MRKYTTDQLKEEMFKRVGKENAGIPRHALTALDVKFAANALGNTVLIMTRAMCDPESLPADMRVPDQFQDDHESLMGSLAAVTGAAFRMGELAKMASDSDGDAPTDGESDAEGVQEAMRKLSDIVAAFGARNAGNETQH